MGPKQPAADSRDFFRQPLVDMINPKHPLVSLAVVIDWDEIEQSFGAHFASSVGRPPEFNSFCTQVSDLIELTLKSADYKCGL